MITNLDKVPQTLLIDNYGQLERVTILPNRHIRRFSNVLRVQVEFSGQRAEIRDHDEYVIWPGGRLSIQRNGRRKGCCVF